MAIRFRLVAFALVLQVSAAASVQAEFQPIFDGKTLDGWVPSDQLNPDGSLKQREVFPGFDEGSKNPGVSYWSVEDGAITARSTPEHPCKTNQFLVWQLGEVDDFELKLKYRIQGGPRANSGIQIRSQIQPDGHVVGYQCDLDMAGNWAGAIYDEHGRKLLADRGQRAVIADGGKIEHTQIADKAERFKVIDVDGWNDYHIIARGDHISTYINGKLMALVVDRDRKDREFAGVLAVQLHSGPPMTVQFKDVQLNRLPMLDGRKKIVMVAGEPSHGPGEHEFNAGVKLLAGCLADNDQVVVARYHDNGWPKDPTAFDDANAIVLYMDGWKKHAINEHVKQVDKLADSGVGLMMMHYAVHTEPGEMGDYFQKWIGGFYETGFSANPHWKADLKHAQGHPITRGVNDSTIEDEWYFNIRFREGMKDVTAISKGIPTDENITVARRGSQWWSDYAERSLGKPQVVMWAVERVDGGRGVGFTGGHWHHNWADENQRRLVLNAMLWVAGAKVPESGVVSEVTDAQMKANHDPKPPKKAKKAPKKK